MAFVSKASSLNMCSYISILFFLFVCVFHLRVSVHPMHAWTCGGQKGVLDSLELESWNWSRRWLLDARWILGSGPQYSARAASVFDS